MSAHHVVGVVNAVLKQCNVVLELIATVEDLGLVDGDALFVLELGLERADGPGVLSVQEATNAGRDPSVMMVQDLDEESIELIRPHWVVISVHAVWGA